ncbi:probable mediator of RNA polymerase II transcription subunit 26b [Solanum dulcamara]|uniref:probable mediator of RNA polymerase II transcription subunit 26b n=1 Tax=Solanum dulcamara TaxID=45834 RepID=UPI00248570E6|nr:probable mediator of RNA polymerase II transcription subunit 26b [Solanum dulcamara]
MTNISGELSKWRDFFGSANSNVFDILEFAVRVAAIDHPKEFKLRRDRITELLYSFRGFGCDNVENVVPNADKVVANTVDVDGDKGTRKCKNEFVREFKGCDVKERKSGEMSVTEIEALSDEIEEESRVVKEVLSIKKIIDNNQNESDSNIYKSLRRLQLMALSVETLQETEIGKSVYALKRHNSKNIRYLVKTIVKDWMYMVKEWVDARAAFTERNPESTKAFVVDGEEEGLPSPPLEDLPFLSTQTTSIELSQIFDGMDDDGNVLRSADKKDEQKKKQTSLVKPNKPPGGNYGRGRPTKPTLERKLNNDHEMKLQQKSDKSKIQTRLVPTQQNFIVSLYLKLKCPDQDEEHVKFEATKRKLQEHYQEAENAKRQRAIQVMKLHEIPKQGRGVRNPQMRPSNYNRPLANKPR